MVTEISGDWKYLRQVFSFNTHWNSASDICHFCRVGKFQYAGLRPPQWRTTTQFINDVLPFSNPSAFILLPHFDVSMVQICSLHVLNLGLLWTCNASAMLYLLEKGAYGPPSLGLAELLERCHADFISWATSNKIRHSQRRFTTQLVIKKESGAYMTTKGWNSQMVTDFLAHCFLSIWRRELPLPGRSLGRWLHEQGRNLSFEDGDEMWAPTAVALTLGH